MLQTELVIIRPKGEMYSTMQMVQGPMLLLCILLHCIAYNYAFKKKFSLSICSRLNRYSILQYMMIIMNMHTFKMYLE